MVAHIRDAKPAVLRRRLSLAQHPRGLRIGAVLKFGETMRERERRDAQLHHGRTLYPAAVLHAKSWNLDIGVRGRTPLEFAVGTAASRIAGRARRAELAVERR